LLLLRPYLFGAALLGLVSGIARFGFAMADVNASSSGVGNIMTIRNPEFAVWLLRPMFVSGLFCCCLAATSLAVDPAPCCSVRALLLASMAALSGILNPSLLSSFRTTYGQVLFAKLAIYWRDAAAGRRKPILADTEPRPSRTHSRLAFSPKPGCRSRVGLGRRVWNSLARVAMKKTHARTAPAGALL
jgi:hypothetical protein